MTNFYSEDPLKESFASESNEYDSFLTDRKQKPVIGGHHPTQTADFGEKQYFISSRTQDESEILKNDKINLPLQTKQPQVRTQQHAYIQLRLTRPIQNIQKYEEIMNKQVLQYLSSVLQESNEMSQKAGQIPLSIRVINQNKILEISHFDHVMTLPMLDPSYLQTHEIRVSGASNMFVNTVWETLSILKENMPAYLTISVTQDTPEAKFLGFGGTQENHFQILEQHRRQISCLMSLREDKRMLSQDEIYDVMWVLKQTSNLKDFRGQATCLVLLNDTFKVEQSLDFLMKDNEKDLKIFLETIELVLSKKSSQQMSSSITHATKILEVLTNINEINLGNISILEYNNTSVDIPVEMLPQSTRMCVFQLAESNDLERISRIMEHLATTKDTQEDINYMTQKYQLNQKITKILKKYCNGEYGFESLSSKSGKFQLSLIKLTQSLLKNDTQFYEYLTNQTIDYIAQIVEEAIIYAHQGSMQKQIYEFINISLDIFDSTLKHQFIEFSPFINENLQKIQKRFQKIVQRKNNPLLANFQNQKEEKTQAQANILDEFYDIESLVDLQPELKYLAIRVANLVQKSSAISNLVKQDHQVNPTFKNYEYRPQVQYAEHDHPEPLNDVKQGLRKQRDETLQLISNYQDSAESLGLDQTDEADLGGIAALKNIPGLSDESSNKMGTGTQNQILKHIGIKSQGPSAGQYSVDRRQTYTNEPEINENEDPKQESLKKMRNPLRLKHVVNHSIGTDQLTSTKNISNYNTLDNHVIESYRHFQNQQ